MTITFSVHNALSEETAQPTVNYIFISLSFELSLYSWNAGLDRWWYTGEWAVSYESEWNGVWIDPYGSVKN